MLQTRERLDNEVFKPSNIQNDKVIDLIESALSEIDQVTSISSAERLRIQGFLNEAKKELISKDISWSRVIGALVIVAAVTSGLADAPNAAKNVKDAIDYIMGSSIERTLQKTLPSPPAQNSEQSRIA